MSPMRRSCSGILLLAGLAGIVSTAHAAETAIGETTFGGKVFIDATHLSTTRDGVDDDSTGVDLTRLYFDIDHRFSPVWSAHLTTDVNWLRGESDPTDVWIKHAYVQGAFSKAFVLRVGAADMPWAAMANQWYGFRYVDNELVSRLKFASTADWGVHVQGAPADGPRLDYAVSVVTGSSYKRPRTGNRPDVEARLGWQPSEHSVIAVGGYDGQLGLDDDTQALTHTARRWDALAAYAGPRYRLGAQWFESRDWTQLRSPLSDGAHGWSTWASAKLSERWTLFARHDDTSTSAQLDPSRHDRYSNAGIEWRVSPKLLVAAAWKHQRLRDRSGERASANEAGLWAQFAF
ncbi:hypothetical protein [Cognatiluteimonas telluris]|uniref:hypothetical protein n=1 Tax=Cognatiluteimonas telluris TaxID=1104775 RepID=UPI00140D7F01|nr:hypothetical protein [Lysobacter telluris]